jgi:carbonic anhydrase
MLTFKDHELRDRLERDRGTAFFAPNHFHAFDDLNANIRRQIQKVEAHPWTPKEIPVRGFIYDVRTEGLGEVKS